MTFNPGPSPFRLRIGVTNSGSVASADAPWRLYVDKNGEGYNPVTPSSVFARAADAGSSSDETAITVRRLGG